MRRKKRPSVTTALSSYLSEAALRVTSQFPPNRRQAIKYKRKALYMIIIEVGGREKKETKEE